MTDSPILTVKMVSSGWKCRPAIVYSLVASGKLRAFRLGTRAYRVRLEEVERYEREQEAA